MSAEIGLPGWIGEQTYTSLKSTLASIGNQPLRLWIDSEGGEAFYAMEMFKLLQAHRPLTTIINGRAESAASVVFLAGFPRFIEEHSSIMIHDPIIHPRYAGNVEHDDQCRQWFIGCYETRTGLDRSTIEQMMRKETRISAEEAVKLGFAHSIARARPRTDNAQRLTPPRMH